MNTKAKWARQLLVAEVALAVLALSYAYFVLDRAPSAPSPEQYTAWAASAGPQQEVVEARGRFSKVFQVASDINMLRLSSEPIHFRNAVGEWEDIDLTVRQAAPGAEYGLEATHNEAQVYFKRYAVGSGYLVRYVARGGEVEFGVEAEQAWGRLQPVQAQVQGNVVVYPNLFSGADWRYELSPLRMLEGLVVRESEVAQHLGVIEKRFRVTGATWQMQPDGSILFSRDGAALWRVPRPVMYERGNPEVKSYRLHFELEEREGHVTLRKVLDAEGQTWLRDPSRQFPVIIDDTVDLDDQDLTVNPTLTLDAGYGDGYISQQVTGGNCANLNGTYTLNDSDTSNYIGCHTSDTTAVYRAFFDWDTTDVNNISGISGKINAVGVYLYGNNTYNNPVIFRQLDYRPSQYSTAGALWTAIGDTNHKRYTTYDSLTTGYNYYNLGCRPATAACSTDAIDTLESNLGGGPNANKFWFGMQGQLESDSTQYGYYVAKEAPDSQVGQRPDLVVFYQGASGAWDVPDRTLRNTFWDGQYYWMFYNASDTTGIRYAYSSDGANWTPVPTPYPDTLASSKHHALWYDAAANKVYLAYHVQTGTGVGVGDLRVNVGNVTDPSLPSTPSIAWGTASTPFNADETAYEGYDFPDIVKDANGYCWVASRFGTNAPGAQIGYAERLVRSTDTPCTQWPTTPVSLPTRQSSSVGDFRSVGGYVVPLVDASGTPSAYLVVKDRVPAPAANPLIGMLCNYDASSCPSATQTIDDNAGQGVYTFGMSAVGAGQEVHLVYIDCAGNCLDGSSLQYTYRSAGASGTWIPPTPLVTATAVYYNPSLSRADNSGNDLYVFIRTDRQLGGSSPPTPVPHSASAAIYYKRGTRAGVGVPYIWTTTPDLSTNLLNLWAPVDATQSGNSLFSSYGAKGYGTTNLRLIIGWVEGIYGMDAKTLTPP